MTEQDQKYYDGLQETSSKLREQAKEAAENAAKFSSKYYDGLANSLEAEAKKCDALAETIAKSSQ